MHKVSISRLTITILKTTASISPEDCYKCDGNLRDVPVTAIDERTKIDIVYDITELTVTSESKECHKCGFTSKAKFPAGMDGKVQYGIGIKASIINFLMVQIISLERVSEHFKGLIGRFISQVIMLKYITQFSYSLEKWEQGQIERILGSPVIYCDETSLRVDKKNYWIHSYSYGDKPSSFFMRSEEVKLLKK